MSMANEWATTAAERQFKCQTEKKWRSACAMEHLRQIELWKLFFKLDLHFACSGERAKIYLQQNGKQTTDLTLSKTIWFNEKSKTKLSNFRYAKRPIFFIVVFFSSFDLIELCETIFPQCKCTYEAFKWILAFEINFPSLFDWITFIILCASPLNVGCHSLYWCLFSTLSSNIDSIPLWR